MQYPVPKNLKEVQRFLGMSGWYHRFVPGFSKIAEPLNNLKRKGQPFIWSLECQNAFEELKSHLTSSPVLGHPKPDLPFTVYTDASETGLGAVLAQKTGTDSEQVIAYASRTLTKAEVNYSATEKECLAVVWALEKWQYYLEPKVFTVVTDHSALQWVLTSNKSTSRLLRWALRLQKFDFIVEFRRGKLNVVPDALSRIPLGVECNLFSTKGKAEDLPFSADMVWAEQHQDPEIEKVFRALAEGDSVMMGKFTVLEDKVYRKTQVSEHQCHYRMYIPSSLKARMLQAYHENPLCGHLGIFKTFKRIHDVAFWPKMWSEVKDFVKCCETCQVLKSDNKKPPGKIQQTVVNRPNELLGVDLMGPFPRSSHQHEYIMVVVDYYTRWVEIFPMRTATASSITRILRTEVLTRWGVPEYILSDRGSQFVSSIFQELCAQWKVMPKLTTAYHPQTNMTERVNRTLKCMIASYVEDNHRKWDTYLPEFRFALNTAVQETTGLTPAEFQVGRKLTSDF